MSDYLEVQLRRSIFRASNVTVRGNSTAYVSGDRIMLGTSDLNVYECTIAGTSAGSPPAFNTTLGVTTTDGGVTWIALKQGYPKRPIYISLHTADPTDAGTGTEVSGGSYARVNLDPSDTNWSAPDATGGLTQNLVQITFPAPTASWGLIQYFGIWDRATGGNFIAGDALTTPKTVNNGDPAPLFPTSALSLTFA
jgi:hypothetical protein